MKAQDFRELATRLDNFNPGLYAEAKIRTQISRYYYYIFLHLRDEIILKYDKRQKTKEKLTKGSVHSALGTYLAKIVITLKTLKVEDYIIRDLTDLITNLDQLKKDRTDSDYQLDLPISTKRLENAEKRVAKIERYIPLLDKAINNLSEKGKLPPV
ncbi:hypothetical protein APY94_04075 [Thermococcus celericrescens]|uniref:HEPN domain-containing protein n=1 Tax=Thermococcus celericrescens TaxID=227598 RepID=A0A100XYM5_9EURY|nr:hypothetical protein [Thermococcus celericrescens]KUH33915.1 hypothetical protein APY94_04075 [Thermococcus celericrescens]